MSASQQPTLSSRVSQALTKPVVAALGGAALATAAAAAYCKWRRCRSARTSPNEWSSAYPLPVSGQVSSIPERLRDTGATSVLFDMDGTLVESKEIWYILLNALSIHLGYGPLPREKWEPTFGQSMEDNRVSFFPNSSQKEIDDYCDEHYHEHLSHLEILPGAIEALNATKAFLGGSTDRMFICTNCPAKITQLIIASEPALAEFFPPERIVCAGSTVTLKAPVAAFDFTPAQSAVIASGQPLEYVLQAKPSTDIITRATSLLGVRASDAIFVGDSKFDMISSMRASCFAIGIGEKGTGGNMLIENIAQLADKLAAPAKKQ